MPWQLPEFVAAARSFLAAARFLVADATGFSRCFCCLLGKNYTACGVFFFFLMIIFLNDFFKVPTIVLLLLLYIFMNQLPESVPGVTIVCRRLFLNKRFDYAYYIPASRCDQNMNPIS